MKSQIFLASYHQERLWFIDNFENGILYKFAPVYHNIPLILKINGKLDEVLIRRSLDILVERQEALRTKISIKNEKIVQVIDQEVNFLFKKHKKNDIVPDDEKLFDFYYDLISEPFSIENQNLFKVELIELADDVNILIFVAHHIICDRKSMRIIFEEFTCIYNSLLSNVAVSLPELPIQYADFANWQKEFSDETIEKLMIFWREKLNFIEPLIFHTDQIRKPVHVYEAGIVEEKLQRSISEKISQFEESEYYIFLTAFEILMHKYSGQNKIVIGTVSENRDMEDLKNIIGPISNLIVLNNEISEKETVSDIVSLNRSSHQHALNYASMPFDKLVAELKPEIDMSRTALFDVLFHYEDHITDNLKYKIGTTRCEIIETNLGLGKYDFNLLVRKHDSDFFLHLTYNKLYYDSETAQRIINHYITLLSNIKDESLLISELEYVTEAEKDQSKLLLDKTNVNWPNEQTLVSLFEEQVEKQTSKTAIIVQDLEISYQDLNSLANQFSNFLIKKYDVKLQDYVALLLPRNEQQIIAILAILKCGAVYVPIDQEYPQERVDYILNDCFAKVLIDEKLFLEFLNYKDSFLNSNLQLSISPHDLAYVIYTSGSTGMPKGVMIEHRNVVRLFINDSPLFSFSENDVWTMFHSYCFDFSVWEIYGALIFGGSLVIIPKSIAIDPTAFLSVLEKNSVTVLNQTPSAFYNLLAIKPWEISNKLALKYIVFGGEALHPGKLVNWNQFYPSVKLINMYGITEITVHATYKEITKQEILSDICNIGAPIPTLSCFILDDKKRILPKLIPGELWVGGDGLARGYLNMNEFTNEKFISNPYGPGRLYSSGDIVRQLSNGELEYIGRKDDQVKVRGFRIELGEIEKAFLKNDEIEDVIVIVNKNQYDENELVAYFTSEKEQNIFTITTSLKSILPYYMVPSYYVQVDDFKLNNNGKIDKLVLPCFESNQLSSGKEYVAPRNEIEEKLAAIWQEVLAIEKVGITDNFFELGGHSLMAIKILHKINEVFNFSFGLDYLFNSPTIAKLSEIIYVLNDNEIKKGETAKEIYKI